MSKYDDPAYQESRWPGLPETLRKELAADAKEAVITGFPQAIEAAMEYYREHYESMEE